MLLDSFFISSFLAQVSLEAITQFHVYFFYAPLVFFIAALVADIFNYFGYTRAFTIGHWLIIAGVVMCVPTIVSGQIAAYSFDESNPILAKHSYLGNAVGLCGSLYAGLRISTMLWKLPLLPVHYMGMSVLLVALIAWTSTLGGLITEEAMLSNSKLKQSFINDSKGRKAL
jgi:uncharacterized membrane protein